MIFSDDKRYWNVFGPVCREAEKRGVIITYLTQSEDDPCFLEKFNYVKTEYIGQGNKGIAKMNFMNADIVFATTPNLDVFQWKRSRNVKWYVHIPHCVYELLSYRMFGLDSFDAVLLTGDFQAGYIRRLEKMRNSAVKELVTVGYPPIDEAVSRLNSSNSSVHSIETIETIEKNKKEDKVLNKTILIAPSWGESSILARYGSKFLHCAVETGYRVVVRPHPQSSKSEKELLTSLMKEYPENENFSWNFDTDNFNCLKEADILIGDYSGAMFEAAIIFNKPIIYIKGVFDPAIYDAAWFANEKTWRFASLEKIGIEFNTSDFENLKTIIDNAIISPSLERGREEIKNQAWTCRGESAKLIVDYLIQKQKELKIVDEDVEKKVEAV